MAEKILTKLPPLIIILCTTALSVVLALLRGWRDIGQFNKFISGNRDAIAPVIQVLSSTLGIAQISTICSLFNFAARNRLWDTPTNLESISFWSALSIPRLDFSLPFHLLVFLLAFQLATNIPGAIWAGALNPKYTNLVKEAGWIQVPQYPLSSAKSWQGEYWQEESGTYGYTSNCQSTNGTKNFVSSCPALDFLGGLVGSATSATSPDKTPRQHQRLDNSGWTFWGRSYGVGSSPGLVNLTSSSIVNYTGFEYAESGYMSSVTCARNISSNFTLSNINSASDGAVPNNYLWEASGALPNSSPGQVQEYLFAIFTGGPNLFAWSAVANEDQNILAVAAEGWYQAAFDKMQCLIQFSPSTFTVSVNMTTQTIQVSPMTGGNMSTDIEPTGNFTTSVFLTLDVISQITGNNVISVLGNAIKFNLPNVIAQNPQLGLEEVYTQGLEDSITAMIDDLLVSFGASQIVLLNASTNVPLSATYNAIRIGSDKYIFAGLGINIFLLSIVAIEAWRTRFWNKMTRFNFTDVKSVIVAASAGGRSISETYAALHKTSQTLQQNDSGNRVVGKIGVRLVKDNAGPVLVEIGSKGLELTDSAVPLNMNTAK